MREFVDSALTQYRYYMEQYRISWQEALYFEWNALIISLFLAVQNEGRKMFGSAEELLQYLEELLGYYADPDREKEGFVKVTGYTLSGSAISCFSVYSLFVYMHLEDPEERKEFYRTMIWLLFRHECSWEQGDSEPGELARKYLGDALQAEIKENPGNAGKRNGNKIRKEFRRFIRLQCYEKNVNEMEIVKAESSVVEAYFL